MKRLFAVLVVLAVVALLFSPPAATASGAPEAGAKPRSPAGYDPARDPAQDLAAATRRATTEGKRILLEVGGEWCIWCHYLEEFFASHPTVREQLDRGFVLVKVNYSKEQKNEAFLGRYPEVAGYPHLFVLEADGTLLHSQETSELEAEKTYDEEKVAGFLARWARKP